MTKVQKEEQANPYNANKSWHNVKESQFVSADNVFFKEPKVSDSNDEKVETEEVSQEKPSKKQGSNYKKRYDDLKAHYDSKLEEFKVREAELLKEKPQYVAPKSAEDLEDRLVALQQRESELIHRDAEKRLMDKHPDFDNIKNSDDFHGWAKSQPQSIQDWIYKNSNDADLASRALDLYKRDTGLDVPQKKTRSNSRKTKSAADMVSTKTTAVEPKEAKIWSEKDIARMSMDEFDRYEEEINNAITEGRIAR